MIERADDRIAQFSVHARSMEFEIKV